MERNDDPHIIIDTNQTVLCPEIFQEPQRLTPTGKISHAKTRVYTQRYRKEWEQMPDFKGWLTSVPGQATRAFCTFCKKNLHAHRLSLLKHTCTMKHQRAALRHQCEIADKEAEVEKDMLDFDPEFEHVDVKSIKTNENEDDEEETEEYEYVVEGLEMEDDEADESKQHEFHDDNEEEQEDSNEGLSSSKKIKLEKTQHRDTLAEAMAHVHGEYLDGSADDQNHVELDMVVSSANQDLPNDDIEHENHINELTNNQEESKKKLGLKDNTETKVVAYQLNSPQITLAGGQQLATGLTMTPVQNKTIMLSSGKTVTLKTGALPTGYVLSKVKGNLPTLVMAGSKTVKQRPIAPKLTSSILPVVSQQQSTVAVAGPSQQAQKELNMTSYLKQTHPCISTHVVDTNKGLPIGGLQVSLYKLMDGRWTFLNESTTAPNGRCADLVDLKKSQLTAGRYKIHFDVDKYFTLRRIETMYPFIEIVFDVKNPTGNYHIPILLSPFSYTTYRGSDR